MPLPDSMACKKKIQYVSDIGGIVVVTGEVGSGKSTTIRWSLSDFHPSEVYLIPLIAHSGSFIDILKQIALVMNISVKSSSKTFLLKEIKNSIYETVTHKKLKIIMSIDEASLLRSEVFTELHTLTQFDLDSKQLFTIILAGQVGLLDKLSLRCNSPLASRVISRSHLESLSKDRLTAYIKHHLKIAGCSYPELFEEEAITALYQESGGLLRKSNLLAKNAIIAAAYTKSKVITSDHIQIAASEIF